MLPSTALDSVGTPEEGLFAAQYLAHMPPSTLRCRPYGRLRMTRGRCGSLFLHRMRLSLTISHRFSPAHQGADPFEFPL